MPKQAQAKATAKKKPVTLASTNLRIDKLAELLTDRMFNIENQLGNAIRQIPTLDQMAQILGRVDRSQTTRIELPGPGDFPDPPLAMESQLAAQREAIPQQPTNGCAMAPEPTSEIQQLLMLLLEKIDRNRHLTGALVTKIEPVMDRAAFDEAPPHQVDATSDISQAIVSACAQLDANAYFIEQARDRVRC